VWVRTQGTDDLEELDNVEASLAILELRYEGLRLAEDRGELVLGNPRGPAPIDELAPKLLVLSRVNRPTHGVGD
jgi:hypothetical protein